MKHYKLIILDRDGVINQDSDAYIKSMDEWKPIPGSIAAIARLSQCGIKVAVATNQSGVARGFYSIEVMHQIHTALEQQVCVLDGIICQIAFCPHGPEEGCDCRKPKPGLIHQILNEQNIPAEDTLVVGDAMRDLEAAQAAGCDAVLVRTGKGLRTLEKHALETHLVFDDLAQCVEKILETNSPL